MSRDSYIQHAHRHGPNGSDPIEIPSGGTPSVATFYRSAQVEGDAALTITAGDGPIIPWLHAKLPSDGSITGPFISNTRAQFNVPMLTIEFVRVHWEDGAYQRAVVFGTNSRIVPADEYGEANQGDGSLGADGSSKSWVSDFRMNAYIANDITDVYVQNGDTTSRTIDEAWWVIYAWPAAGYLGAIPGYPL